MRQLSSAVPVPLAQIVAASVHKRLALALAGRGRRIDAELGGTLAERLRS
ncbi:MAG: hypothetical protein LBD70_01145 [Bifidobacteriaceae bacterium]|jgi:hypothetical protein|nr:hypothetical protein [Bifidobacteriaceae bacterium]